MWHDWSYVVHHQISESGAPTGTSANMGGDPSADLTKFEI